MINFFRKARKKLIAGNKVTKYLLYATGEILLVVIGILIALTVNNRNEQFKTDQKIDDIFESIKLDLVNDINEANSVIGIYDECDSLQQLVLANKVTAQDYHANPRLRTLIMFFKLFWIEHNGYDALKRNIDNIPDKYNDVLPVLNHIYSKTVPGIEMYNTATKDQLITTMHRWGNNYNWFQTGRETWIAANDSMIDFYLNDSKYKSDVRFFRGVTIWNLRVLSMVYNYEAIITYFKINKAKGIGFNSSLEEFKNQIKDFDKIELQKHKKNDSKSRVVNNKVSFLIVKNNLNKDVHLYYRDINGIDQPIDHRINLAINDNVNGKVDLIQKNDMKVVALMSNNYFLVKNVNGEVLGTFNSSSKTGYLILN